VVREAVLTGIKGGRRRDLTSELLRTAGHDPEPGLRALALDTLRTLRSEQAVEVAAAALSDSEHRVRAAASRVLAELGGPEVVELLRARTADSEPTVRSAAAEGLGAMHAAEAQPELLRLLADVDPSVRQAAASGAAEAGLRPLTPAIIGLLDDPEPAVRHAAVAALGALGDRSAAPALLQQFGEAPPDLREAILDAVSRLDPAATPDLIAALLQIPERKDKLAAARISARLRLPGTIDLLTRLSEDPDPLVRETAIEALGRCSRKEEEEREARSRIVGAAISDPDPHVRARAVDAAARLGLADAGRAIIGLLGGDPSEEVRERAALAIGILPVPGGEAPLIEACRRDEPIGVRAAAALAAGRFDLNSLVLRVLEMGDEAAVRELLRQRLSSDPWFRLLKRKLSRARALEVGALAAPSPDGEAYLADGMRRTLDPGERVRLIGGLRAFRGEQSLSGLLQVVREDPSPEVRAEALAAVGDLLDTEELLGLGGRSLGDPSPLVRRAAVELLSRVIPERALPKLIRSLRPDEDPAVLVAVADLAGREFPSFRTAVAAMPLAAAQSILLVRMARFIHHPELPDLLLPFSRSPWHEVREAVAELGRQRPDALHRQALEALSGDPLVRIREAAANAAARAEQYDLLEDMTQDPDVGVRRQVAIALGRSAPVGDPAFAILEKLSADSEMAVRAAAYVGRLLQGQPVPLPPGISPGVAAEAVRETAELSSLRERAQRTRPEEHRLAAALALALLQDEVALEVARTDPVPSIRHRVSGALELATHGTAAGGA
jgi:HEAT repeat protein